MTQKIRLGFKLGSEPSIERVFQSKNECLMWLNHQLVRQCNLKSVNSITVTLSSYYNNSDLSDIMPF